MGILLYPFLVVCILHNNRHLILQHRRIQHNVLGTILYFGVSRFTRQKIATCWLTKVAFVAYFYKRCRSNITSWYMLITKYWALTCMPFFFFIAIILPITNDTSAIAFFTETTNGNARLFTTKYQIRMMLCHD